MHRIRFYGVQWGLGDGFRIIVLMEFTRNRPKTCDRVYFLGDFKVSEAHDKQQLCLFRLELVTAGVARSQRTEKMQEAGPHVLGQLGKVANSDLFWLPNLWTPSHLWGVLTLQATVRGRATPYHKSWEMPGTCFSSAPGGYGTVCNLGSVRHRHQQEIGREHFRGFFL